MIIKKEQYAMSKRKTNQEFMEQVKNVYGDDVEILTEYHDAKSKILVKYKCGHQDWKIPNKLLAGQTCSICKNIKLSKTKTKTKEQFVSDLKNEDLILNYFQTIKALMNM